MEKENLEWLLTKCELLTERYIETEKFLMEYNELSFFEKLFNGRTRIEKHIDYISKKYKF